MVIAGQINTPRGLNRSHSGDHKAGGDGTCLGRARIGIQEAKTARLSKIVMVMPVRLDTRATVKPVRAGGSTNAAAG
jgi:hypothetical protein